MASIYECERDDDCSSVDSWRRIPEHHHWRSRSSIILLTRSSRSIVIATRRFPDPFIINQLECDISLNAQYFDTDFLETIRCLTISKDMVLWLLVVAFLF